AVESKFILNQACTQSHRILQRLVRSDTVVQLGIGSIPAGIGLDIDAGPESSCTVGRGSHPTLNLDIVYRRGKIRHINPKASQTLRIVVRDSVKRYVCTLSIAAANRNAGMPDTVARIRRHNHRWRLV